MKKKKAKSNKRVYFENERALRELSVMKHRDLQRGCILRGLAPEEVVNFDHHKLVQWFIEHYENSQDQNLLIAFDAYVEEELVRKGYKVGDALMSPSLKMSYVGDIEKMDKPKIIKPEKVQPVSTEPKVKSTIDEVTGIRTGTKKALTYDLTSAKLGIDEIIKRVKVKFPNAQEKSIKIWHKRRLKEM